MAHRRTSSGAWIDAPLVRPGSLNYQDGAFVHDVELVMGVNTSFLTQTVTIGAPMERGQLYIATDGTQRVPRIEPSSRDSGTAQHSPVRLLLPRPPRRRGCAAGVVPLWRRRGARTLAWTVDSRRRLRPSPGLSAAPPPRLNKQTLAANVFNLGCVPRAGRDSQRLEGAD